MPATSAPKAARPQIHVDHGPAWLRPVLRWVGDACIRLPIFLQLPFLAAFTFLPHTLVWWSLVALGNWSLFARWLAGYVLLHVELRLLKHARLDLLDRRARLLILGFGLGAGVTAACVLVVGFTVPLLFRVHAIYAWWWQIVHFVLACSILCAWILLGRGAERLTAFVITPATPTAAAASASATPSEPRSTIAAAAAAAVAASAAAAAAAAAATRSQAAPMPEANTDAVD
jgi:hypothetical protein